MFSKYYDPRDSSDWISKLSEEIVEDLRLHLGWDIGMDMSTCSKKELGNQIVIRLRKNTIIEG